MGYPAEIARFHNFEAAGNKWLDVLLQQRNEELLILDVFRWSKLAPEEWELGVHIDHQADPSSI
jgi:hypothetical protein